MIRHTFTVAEAAEIYTISERRIRTVAQGRGIGTKVGGKLIFTKADIRALRPGKNGRPKGRGGQDDGAGSGPIGPQPLSGELSMDGLTAAEIVINSETMGLVPITEDLLNETAGPKELMDYETIAKKLYEEFRKTHDVLPPWLGAGPEDRKHFMELAKVGNCGTKARNLTGLIALL